MRSPDGREWEVRVRRLRPPPWRQQDWGSDGDRDVPSGVISFGAAIVGGLIVPLLIALVEFPVALVRSAVSKDRWIEARCDWPAEIRIVWQTSRDHAGEARADVVAQLAAGYDHLAPRHATLVEMSQPPGMDDLDR